MKVNLCEELHKHLYLRMMAQRFFNKYSNNTEQMIVSFSGVMSIGRSFVQEYLDLKNRQNYKVTDIDISPNIQRMFDVVKNPKPKPKLLTYSRPKQLEISID